MATISAATFNAIRKKAVAVLGTGGSNPSTDTANSTYGYGQSVTSSAVTVGSIIRASSWIALRNDLVKARTHQIGSVGTGTGQGPAWANLVNITSGTVISNAIVTQFQGVADACVTNRFTVFSSQKGSTSVSSTRTTTWGTTLTVQAITHSFRASFTDSTQARYYFNAGGVINYTASLADGVVANKYTAWVNTLSGMGTLTFAVNQSSTTFGSFAVTKSGASGTTSNITLSGVDQVIYTSTQSAPYGTNTLTVSAKYITTSPYVIEITSVLTDGAAATATGIGPNVDEPLTGTVTSTGTITPIQGAFAITPTIANQLTL
jgi:hypothetical protein